MESLRVWIRMPGQGSRENPTRSGNNTPRFCQCPSGSVFRFFTQDESWGSSKDVRDLRGNRPLHIRGPQTGPKGADQTWPDSTSFTTRIWSRHRVESIPKGWVKMMSKSSPKWGRKGDPNDTRMECHMRSYGSFWEPLRLNLCRNTSSPLMMINKELKMMTKYLLLPRTVLGIGGLSN